MLSLSLSTPISTLAIIFSIIRILHLVHSPTACYEGQLGTFTRKGASPLLLPKSLLLVNDPDIIAIPSTYDRQLHLGTFT
jgi:hypothetical protein